MQVQGLRVGPLLAVVWYGVALLLLHPPLAEGCSTTIGRTIPLICPNRGVLPGNDWLPVAQFQINAGAAPAVRFNPGGRTFTDVYTEHLLFPNPFRFIENPDAQPQDAVQHMVDVNTPPVPLFFEHAGQFPTVLKSVTGVIRPPQVGNVDASTFRVSWISAVALAVDGRLANREPLICDPDNIEWLRGQLGLDPEQFDEYLRTTNRTRLAERRTRGLIATGPGASNGYWDPDDPIIAIYHPTGEERNATLLPFRFDPYQEFVTIQGLLPANAVISNTTPALAYNFDLGGLPDGLRADTAAAIIQASTFSRFVNLADYLKVVEGLDIIPEGSTQGESGPRTYFLLIKMSTAAPHGGLFTVGVNSVVIHQGHELSTGAVVAPVCRSYNLNLLANGFMGNAPILWSEFMKDRPLSVVENTNDLTPIGQGPGVPAEGIELPFYPPTFPSVRWPARNLPQYSDEGSVEGRSFVHSHMDSSLGAESYEDGGFSALSKPKIWEPESQRTVVLGLELAGGQYNHSVDAAHPFLATNDCPSPPGDQRTQLAGLFVEFLSTGEIREIPGDNIDNDGNAFWLQRNGIDDDWDGEDNDANPYTPAVADGKDNDGDGYIDEGIDESGPVGAEGVDEFFCSPDMLEDNDGNPLTPPVADGVDNDGDQFIDEVNDLGDTTPRPHIAVPEIKAGRNDDGDSFVEFYPGLPFSRANVEPSIAHMSMRHRAESATVLPEQLLYFNAAQRLVTAELGWLGLFDPGVDLPVVDVPQWTIDDERDGACLALSNFGQPLPGRLDAFDRVNTQGLIDPSLFEITMCQFINLVRGRETPKGAGAYTTFGVLLHRMDDDRDGRIDEEDLDNVDNDNDGLTDEDCYNWQLVEFDDDRDGRIDEDGEDGLDNDGDGFIDEDVTYVAIEALVEEETPKYFVDMPGGTAGVFDPLEDNDGDPTTPPLRDGRDNDGDGFTDEADQIYVDIDGDGVYDRGFENGRPYQRDEFVYPGWAQAIPQLQNQQPYHSAAPQPFGARVARPLDDDGDAESLTRDRVDNDGDSIDHDRDGYPTGQEVAMGFDPHDAASRPLLDVSPDPAWLYVDEGFNEDVSNPDFTPDDINENFEEHDRDGIQLVRDTNSNSAYNPGADARISTNFRFIPYEGLHREMVLREEMVGRFGAFVNVDAPPGQLALPLINNNRFDFFMVMRLDSDDTGGGVWRSSRGVDYGDDWQVRLSRGGVKLSNMAVPLIARPIQSASGCIQLDGFDDPRTEEIEPLTLMGPRPGSIAKDGLPFAAAHTKRQVAALDMLDTQGFQAGADGIIAFFDPLDVRQGASASLVSRQNMGRGEAAASNGGRPFITPLQTNVPVIGFNVAIFGDAAGAAGFREETINSIRLNFLNVPGPGGGKFEPTDLAPLSTNPLWSGISLVRDVDGNGTMFFNDILAGGIPLNIQQSSWDPDPSDPVVVNGGHYIVLYPATPIGNLPVTDYAETIAGRAGNPGQDFFIVMRASETADFSDSFQVYIRPGDIAFRNLRNGPSSYLITDPIAIDVPMKYVDLLPESGLTVPGRSGSVPVIGIDSVDANLTFKGASARLAALQLSLLTDPNSANQVNPEADLQPLRSDVVHVSQLDPVNFPPERTDPLRYTSLSGVAVFRDAPGSDTPGGFDDPLDPTVLTPDTPVRLGDMEWTDYQLGSISTVLVELDPPSPNFDLDRDGIFHNDQSPERRGIRGGETSVDNIDVSEVDLFDPEPFEPFPPSRSGEHAGPDHFVVLRTSATFTRGKSFRVALRPFVDAEGFVRPAIGFYPYQLNSAYRPFPLTQPDIQAGQWGGITTGQISSSGVFGIRPSLVFINPPPYSPAQPNAVFIPPRAAQAKQPPLIIQWSAFDPDSPATLTVRAIEQRTGNAAVLVAGRTILAGQTPVDNTFSWDISRLTPGDYVIEGVIRDGQTEPLTARTQIVRISNELPRIEIIAPERRSPPVPVPSGESYTIRWRDADYENDAKISLWFDPRPQRPTGPPAANAIRVASGLSEDANGDQGFYTVAIDLLIAAGELRVGQVFWVVAEIDDQVSRFDAQNRPLSSKVYASSPGQLEIRTDVVPTATPTVGPGTPTPIPRLSVRIDVPLSEVGRETMRQRQEVDVVWHDVDRRADVTVTLYWLSTDEPPPLNPATDPLPSADRILQASNGDVALNLPCGDNGGGRFAWDFGGLPAGEYLVFAHFRSGGAFEARRVSANTLSLNAVRWPLELVGMPFHTAPIVADVDGDGADDIVVLTDAGVVLAFAADGRRLARLALGQENILSAGVVVDVRGNGRPWIAYGAPARRLYLVHVATRRVQRIELGNGAPADLPLLTGVAADFNQDGLTDLMVASRDGLAHILLGQANGELEPVPAFSHSLNAPIDAAPVVGHFYRDATPEVVVATQRGDVLVLDAARALARPDRPQDALALAAAFGAPIVSTPLLVNLDSDGEDEIVVALAGTDLVKRGRVYAIDYAPGANRWRTIPISDAVSPRSQSAVSLALAAGRVSGGARPDLVVAGSDRLFLYNVDLERAAPVALLGVVNGQFGHSAPVVGALVGGRGQQIVLGGRTGVTYEELVAFRFDATQGGLVKTAPLAGFEDQARDVLLPRERSGIAPLRASVALADLDGDGVGEIVLATDAMNTGWLAVVEQSGAAEGPLTQDWPQFKRDAARTARFDGVAKPSAPLAGDLNRDGVVNYLDLFKLAERWAADGPAAAAQGAKRVDGQALLQFTADWTESR